MDLGMLIPGDKIDIRILKSLESASEQPNKEFEGNAVSTYLSSIYDIVDEENGILDVTMPQKAGKVLLLRMGILYEFVFITKKGMYKTEGTFIKRKKQGNVFLLQVRLSYEPEKHQRREYYRMSCLLPITYMALSDAVGELENPGVVGEALAVSGFSIFRGVGTMLDLSGGGVRFTASKDFCNSKYVYLQLQLKNPDVRAFEIIGKIIEGKPVDDTPNLYVYRIEFIYEKPQMREKIIRYIFDTERNALHRES